MGITERGVQVWLSEEYCVLDPGEKRDIIALRDSEPPHEMIMGLTPENALTLADSIERAVQMLIDQGRWTPNA